MPTYPEVTSELRRSYDRHAVERSAYEQPKWKLVERALFLELLRSSGKSSLLEIGAGTGQDSLFFQEAGLKVVATDLSAEMVRFCRERGLEAHVMDCLDLSVPPASFDAVYAFNSLLHVPNAELPAALEGIQKVLASGGLFFMSAYAGNDIEGPLVEDTHDPPRFFSFRSDATLLRMVEPYFEVVDFRTVPVAEWQLQALTLRKPQGLTGY